MAAINNVEHHIKKLLKEEKIEKIGLSGYRLLAAEPQTSRMDS